MEPIQFFIILFALFAYSRVILRTKDKKIKPVEFMFWTIIWLAIIIVTFTPSITKPISDLLGIGRGMDLVTSLSIVVLFYLVFRIYVRLQEIDHNLTCVVRKITIERAKKKK